ncbi:glutathione S-transferase T2-like [Phragmites australis]|uniref:glutathione S-transferase T2-like n=1 Tax=Phragmites australis TaxID=29695 RepID=UPI002D76EAD7|nr:glutathione S-transferase T2-like [Phragmites australis]
MGTQGGSSDVPQVEFSQFSQATNHGGHSDLGQFCLGSDEKGRKKVTSRKKKKVDAKTDRTKWTNEEDELLVSAWLNVSQDLVVGMDQSKETYWGRIAKYFNTYKKESMMPRTDKALINHMKLIMDAVTKFTVHYRKVEQLNPSGTNERDKMARACAAYKALEGKPFAYTHCWVLLAEYPKWHAHESAKAQKVLDLAEAQFSQAAGNDIPNDAASNASTDLPRPIGRDQAKASRVRKSSSQSSVPTVSGGVYERQLQDISETKKVMVELKKEQLEVMRLQATVRVNDQDERIMKVDLDSVSGLLREYYRKRQEDIMARWKLLEDQE